MTKRSVLLLVALAMAMLFGQTASAQLGIPIPGTFTPDDSRHLTPQQKEKFKKIEQEYQSTMKKVPDKKQPYDPWADARQDTPTKQGQH